MTGSHLQQEKPPKKVSETSDKSCKGSTWCAQDRDNVYLSCYLSNRETFLVDGFWTEKRFHDQRYSGTDALQEAPALQSARENN